MSVVVQGNREKIVFDIVPMSRHVVILGMPWLRQHNPQVDWKTGRFTFSHGTANHEGPERRQRSPSDELLTIHRNQEETTTGHKDLEQAVQPLPRPEASQSKSADQGNDLEIPEEYTMYAVIFSNEQDERALPEHQWWDHEIKLEPGRVPRHTRIYALSEKEHDALREYIDENIKKGFIRKSQSPISHGILFVPKKNGKLRLCVDFRPLNDMTVKNRYPLPSIKELQDRLGKAKYFTKLDLRGAYNLIRMKEGEEWKTAFNTRFGLFEYTVMPFGLTNAPATCQELMNDTLREFLDIFVTVYLDNILIYTDRTLEKHKEHVKKVFQKLIERNLKVALEKCEFYKIEVEFLGYIIGINRIKMDPTKIKSVIE